MTAADAALGGAVSTAAPDVACTHCGLPVSAGLIEASAREQFCCGGCRTAFRIIHDHGLDTFHDTTGGRDGPVAAGPSLGRSFEEFDHATFRELYVRRTPDGLAQVDLYLEGVHCGACVWLVERVPLVVPGVARAELNVRRSLARVVWDDSVVSLSEVARKLEVVG
jgi:P-type Cu2+ transporter